MAFRLEFSVEAERDFGLIFDHLLNSYLGFGESPESGLDHAEARVLEIRAAAERILTAPHRGQRHDDILPGGRLKRNLQCFAWGADWNSLNLPEFQNSWLVARYPAPVRLPGSAGQGTEESAHRGTGGAMAAAGPRRWHGQELHGAPSLADEEDWKAGHRAQGQRDLGGRRAVRDLNWDLLQLQRRAGDDRSHATRRDRSYALAQMANALHEAGYRDLRAKGLKGKHVEALVRHWRSRRLSDATMMNRMAHVRWWAG